MSEALDIAANRRARKWTRGELAGRVLWSLSRPLFRFSPRLLWGWRRGLLRLFGARIGRDVHIHPTASVTIPWNLRAEAYAAIGHAVQVDNLGPVFIGRAATLSRGVHICAGTHDHTRPDLPLVKAGITIEDGVWVCADAFVGPDVTVASHAIVGARAVVMQDVPAWTIVAGNPARPIRSREPFSPS